MCVDKKWYICQLYICIELFARNCYPLILAEPGILLMHHSLRAHPQITASLLDFLCRVSADNVYDCMK